MLRVSITALALAGLLVPVAASAPGPTSLRVLFVGNSLTATNDLPGYVEALAAARGRRVESKTIAPGGFSLEDHWHAGTAPAELATGNWDVIVMQQGPSALRESEDNLQVWAKRFADAARSAGTTPALLTVWPESYRRPQLVTVMGSYRRSAKVAGAVLLPGGDAWWEAWRCRDRFPLYGSDGFHPSRLGTYLAALVAYGRLFGDSPLNAPADLKRFGVAFATAAKNARLARTAAATVLGVRPRSVPRCG